MNGYGICPVFGNQSFAGFAQTSGFPSEDTGRWKGIVNPASGFFESGKQSYILMEPTMDWCLWNRLSGGNVLWN